MARTTNDPNIMQMALLGYQVQKDRIVAKMDELRAQMKGKPSVAVAAAPSKNGGRRNLSQAARERIAEAQRKRWAEYHKQKEATA